MEYHFNSIVVKDCKEFVEKISCGYIFDCVVFDVDSNKYQLFDYVNKNDIDKSIKDYILAKCYISEIGTQMDLKKAESILLPYIDCPDLRFKNLLGVIYWTLYGHNKSREVFREIAEKGFVTAQANLAGDEEISFVERKEWAEKAATSEYPSSKAQRLLGDFYEKENDLNKAIYWWKKAIEQEYPNNIALFHLGRTLFNKGKKEEAKKYFVDASKYGNIAANYYLGLYYEELKDYDKALDYLEKAKNAGYSEADDLYERLTTINNHISYLHQKLKVPEAIDVFISWNHKSLHLKNRIKWWLRFKGISVWESDEKCEGILDNDVKYAIRHAKAYIIIITPTLINESKYVPKEVEEIYNRLEKDNLPETLVFPFFPDINYNYRSDIEKKPEDHPYRKLLNLSADFTRKIKFIIKKSKQKVLEFKVLGYQKYLKDQFQFFPITLSKLCDDDKNLSSAIDYQDGYINRDLFDKDENKVNQEMLLDHKGYSLIYGAGGCGKSLYVKNLIRENSLEKNFFFYLPCVEIEKNLAYSNTIYDLIDNICIKQAKIEGIRKNQIKDIFNNDERNFYIVIDALDELNNKERLFDLIKTGFPVDNIKTNINFIFTSRSLDDSRYITEMLDCKPYTLNLKEMSEEDIKILFENIYSKNKNEADSKDTKDKFIHNLPLIADDVKKNPLLISNLIYIYLKTKIIRPQISYILEKSSEALYDILEDRRKNSIMRQDALGNLNPDVKLFDILEEIAYFSSIKNEIDVLKIINDQVKDYNKSQKLYAYLQKRCILVGNRLSHEIYNSYFAARYVYRKTHKIEPSNVGLEIISLVTENDKIILDEYASQIFSNADNAMLTDYYIAKADLMMHENLGNYEINSNKNQIFEKTLKTFDLTYETVFAKNAISEEALCVIKESLEKNSIVYFYPEFIKDRIKR